MSYLSFIALPRKLRSYPISSFDSRIDELCTHHPLLCSTEEDLCLYFPPSALLDDGVVWIYENEVATFENCFLNPYIYNYRVEIVDNFAEEKMKIIEEFFKEEKLHGQLDKDAMDRKLEKYRVIENRKYLKILHSFINDNLVGGEFAEICTLWTDHVNSNYGSPTSQENIDLDDYPNIPVQIRSLSIGEMRKLTICKTK